ncbi:MAG TPA: hypothetical protein VM187_04010 [Niastella sp.]|nr:hypothetical protein [Niastella sp.]
MGGFLLLRDGKIQHPKAPILHVQIISATGQLLKDIRLSANGVISNVDLSGLSNGLIMLFTRMVRGV